MTLIFLIGSALLAILSLAGIWLLRRQQSTDRPNNSWQPPLFAGLGVATAVSVMLGVVVVVFELLVGLGGLILISALYMFPGWFAIWTGVGALFWLFRNRSKLTDRVILGYGALSVFLISLGVWISQKAWEYLLELLLSQF